MFAIAMASAASLFVAEPIGPDAGAAGAVLNVTTNEEIRGGAVRVTIYDSAETFLEAPAEKIAGEIGEDGVVAFDLAGLTPGEYAFAIYIDENGDGKLNRNPIGLPTERYAFSNGFGAKLRKPTFEETKVEIAPGTLIEIDLRDD